MGILDRFRRKSEAEKRQDEEYDQVMRKYREEQKTLGQQKSLYRKTFGYPKPKSQFQPTEGEQAFGNFMQAAEEGKGEIQKAPESRKFFTPKRFDYGGHFSKQVKNYGNWIFILIGVIVSAFVNYWFAAPFVILFFYSLFPSEWKLRLDAERQFYEMFPGVPMEDKHIEEYIDAHKDLFFLKSFLKIAVILSFATAFYFGTGNMLLVLVSIFIGYFTLPSQMREDKPETAFSAYLRPLLGIGIAILFLIVFESGVLFLLALAFFFYPPVELETEYKKVKGIPLPHVYSLGGAYKILFVVVMLAVAGLMYWNGSFSILEGWGLELQSALGITMGSIWLMSTFAGYSSSPQSRAYIGLIMIAITMVAYSSAFPATVGTAVFGQWWPAVDSAITSITAPLGDAWEQASSGMGSAFMMMSNPSAYYEQQMAQQQASANIKSGGTTKSIEVSGDFLINNVPEQPLLASATLENRGEFKATNIKATLTQLQTKSKDRGVLSPQKDVAYKFVTCSGATPTETNSAGDTCTWPEPSYNGDMKLMTFTYGDKNVWGDIGKCDCAVGSDKSDCIPTDDDINGCKYCYADETKTTNCADSGGIIEYPYAGKTVSVGFNYSFDYIVNVSLDLQLMQSDTLNDLLLKKQIRLQDVEAQYSGGPVRASIWTMKQPVRANEDTLAVITILNQGTGTVKSGAEYVLTIPFVSGMKAEDLKITEVSSSGLKCEKPAAKPVANPDSYELRCNLEKDLGKQKDAKYGFIFNYNNIPKNVDRKTVLFVGNANYQYENSFAKETQITWIPPQ